MQRILSKARSINLLSLGTFSFARFNVDHISSKILEMTSGHAALQFYRQDKDKLRPDQLALTLRIFGKFLNYNSEQEYSKVMESEDFKELLQKISDNISFLNENDCADVLFFMRKSSTIMKKRPFSEDFVSHLVSKVNEHAKAGTFNFGSLTSIYFDLKCINKDISFIVNEINSRLKDESLFLTNYFVISSTNIIVEKGIRYNGEIQMLDLILKKIENSISSFELSTLITLFKNVSMIKPHVTMFPYVNHKILYSLRNVILENLENLNEGAVVSILEAYKHLPRDFPKDILEEVKDMFLLTAEYSPSSITSKSLIDFLHKLSSLKMKIKPLKDEQKEKLEEILTSQIEANFNFMSTRTTQDKLHQIFRYNFLSNKSFLQTMYAKIIERENFQVPIFDLILLFDARIGKIDEIAEKIIGMLDNQSYIPLQDAFKLKIYLEHKGHPLASKFSEKSESVFEEHLSKNPLRNFESISFLNKRGIRNPELTEKYFQLLKENLADRRFNFQVYQCLFSGVDMKYHSEIKNMIVSKLESASDVGSFIQIFFSLETDLFANNMFVDILSRIDPSLVPINKLLSFASLSESFLQGVEKQLVMWEKLTTLLKKCIENDDRRVSLNEVYKFFTSLERIGYTPHFFYAKWRELYLLIQSKNDNPEKFTNHIDRFFMQKLLFSAKFLPTNALEIYEQVKEKFRHNHTARLLLIDSASINSDYDYLIEEILQSNSEQLSDKSNRRMAIDLFCEIIRMPPRILTNPKSINDHLNEIFSFINFDAFLKICKSIPVNSLSKNKNVYYGLLKELTQYIEVNVHRFTNQILLQTLQTFNNFGSKNARLIDLLATEFLKKERFPKQWHILSLIDSLKRMNCQNVEACELAIQSISSKDFSVKKYAAQVFRSLALVGYKSDKLNELIERQTGLIKNSKVFISNVYFTALASIISDTPCEKDLIERYYEQNVQLGITGREKYLENFFFFANYVISKYEDNAAWKEFFTILIEGSNHTLFNKFMSPFVESMKKNVKNILKLGNSGFTGNESGIRRRRRRL